MRIGIEAQNLYSSRKSEADYHSLELIRNLKQLDKENEYVVFVRKGPDRCILSKNNIKVVEVKAKTFLDWEQYQLPKKIKAEEIDLMHFTSGTAPVNFHLPYVATIYQTVGFKDFSFSLSVKEMLKWMYRKWLIPLTASKAKKVITTSYFEKDKIEKYLHNQHKTEVIYYGMSADFIKLSVNKNSVDPQNLPKKYILLMDHSGAGVNLRSMVKAYAVYSSVYPDGLPMLVSEKEKPVVCNLLQQINKSYLEERIISYPESLEEKQFENIYSHCNVLLYPTKSENAGKQIIEAMACGAPIITSNQGVVAEIVRDAAVKVQPEDFEEIAKAMIKTLNDEHFRERLNKKGVERSEDFNCLASVIQTLDIYYEVLGKRRLHHEELVLL